MLSTTERWFMEKNLAISMTQINAHVFCKFNLKERDSGGVRKGCCLKGSVR